MQIYWSHKSIPELAGDHRRTPSRVACRFLEGPSPLASLGGRCQLRLLHTHWLGHGHAGGFPNDWHVGRGRCRQLLVLAGRYRLRPTVFPELRRALPR